MLNRPSATYNLEITSQEFGGRHLRVNVAEQRSRDKPAGTSYLHHITSHYITSHHPAGRGGWDAPRSDRSAASASSSHDRAPRDYPARGPPPRDSRPLRDDRPPRAEREQTLDLFSARKPDPEPQSEVAAVTLHHHPCLRVDTLQNPSPPKTVVLAPGQYTFKRVDIKPHLVPAEARACCMLILCSHHSVQCHRGIFSLHDFDVCAVSSAASTAALDAAALDGAITNALQSASEYGSRVSISVQFGLALFIVPATFVNKVCSWCRNGVSLKICRASLRMTLRGWSTAATYVRCL